MVYSNVSLYRHGTYDAEPCQREEKHGESKVLAQRVLSGPRACHINGDGDRTGQQRAKQVRDRQPTHQRVKRSFFLFFPRFTKDHDGDEVSNHPENEHNGRNGGDHGPPCGLIIHCEVQTHFKTSEATLFIACISSPEQETYLQVKEAWAAFSK